MSRARPFFPAPQRHRPAPLGRVLAALVGLACAAGCPRPPPATQAAPPPAASAPPLGLRPEPIGQRAAGTPWIAHVAAVDLDRDGRLDVLACEAQAGHVLWLRQTESGGFDERLLAADLRAPVHAEAADLDGDGDLDVVVASMGFVFPNNDRIGTVFILENDGRQRFTARPVLEHTERVTDVRVADFDGDGKLDLALAQFGYDQGSVSWLQRTGPWTFRRHALLELSGAVALGVADFNGDGRPDLAALVSQQWEELHLFENTGGAFKARRLWGSTNEDFGSSGLSVADLNADGRPDLVFSNGDGFGPAATPGPRPWHGVQWLENRGDGTWRFARIGDLAGAYSPVAVDLDRDGALDVVAVAAYASRGLAGGSHPSLVWFRHDGRGGFTAQPLAVAPRDQLALAVGDFARDGRPALVTGGFFLAAAYDGLGRLTLWRP